VRVAYLIDQLGVGGTERQLLGLIDRLDRTRVQPYLCLLDGTSLASQALEPPDCPLVRLGVSKLLSKKGLQAAREFVQFLRREQIEVLQLHFPDSTYFGAPLGRRAGVRAIIATQRDLGYWVGARDRRLGRWYARLCCDHLLANGESCRQAAIDHFGWDVARSSVIQNGIDLDDYRPRINSPSSDAALVGMTANLRDVKDPLTFIAAAIAVCAQRTDVQFELAGEGPLRPQLEQRIAAAGLGARIRLLGAVADVARLIQRFDIAVLTSRSEGFSNAVLEYMAVGTPVVATDVGGNRELIEHEQDGLLVPVGDSQALASAILRLLNQPELGERLARSARQKVEASYAWPRVARSYEAFYASMAQRETGE
jgi:glycosyltransferase involved in cell wall biosynthesis